MSFHLDTNLYSPSHLKVMTSDPSEKPPDEATPDPKQLDFETLQKLRKAGYPKPVGVPWPVWLGLKKLSPRHHTIALMLAVGKPQHEIAEQIGMTQSRLSLVTNCPRMQREVAKLRQEYFGQNTASAFMRMLPKATKFYDETLDSYNPKLAGVKFKVAQDLMNRALGKPKETIEIKNQTVRELYVFLDQIKAGEKSLDFTRTHTQPNSNDIETTATAVSSAPKKRDEFAEIDAWVEKTIPKSSGLGRKDE